MISCTDFIPAYSELFRYLEQRAGRDAVIDYWHYLSDNYLSNLRGLVEEHGLYGCWLYWSHTLSEEAASFSLELDEDEGEFTIHMHWCPSKGRLLALDHFEPYHDYCGHCDVIYRRVLEPLGFECTFDMSRVDRAQCTATIRKKPGSEMLQ